MPSKYVKKGYTPIQLNIACRVRNFGGRAGIEGACGFITQAKISEGVLPYGTCGKVTPPGKCSAHQNHPCIIAGVGTGAECRKYLETFNEAGGFTTRSGKK